MTKRKKNVTKPKQPRGNKWGIFITVVMLVLAVLGTLGASYIRSLISPINVDPGEILLQQSPWSMKSSFTVSNLRPDKTQYNIWIMLEFNDCTLDLKDVSFEFPNLEDTIASTTGSIVAYYDCVIVKGYDTHNKQIAFLIIHHLLPSQSLQIITNVNSSQGFIGGKNARISISSIRHSDTPVSLVSKEGEIAYPAFELPFSFTPTSYVQKLKQQ